MTATRKPAALHLTWNVDLTITIRCDRKVVFKTTRWFAKDEAESFCKGWFGDHPQRIRWTFVRSKKEMAARAA